jgi:hypothetical protein
MDEAVLKKVEEMMRASEERITKEIDARLPPPTKLTRAVYHPMTAVAIIAAPIGLWMYASFFSPGK